MSDDIIPSTPAEDALHASIRAMEELWKGPEFERAEMIRLAFRAGELHERRRCTGIVECYESAGVVDIEYAMSLVAARIGAGA